MAKIQLNGKKMSIKSKFSLMDLLKKYKLANKKIAIEHNGIIIPKVSCVYERQTRESRLQRGEYT